MSTLIHSGDDTAAQIRDQVEAWLANPIGKLELVAAGADVDDIDALVYEGFATIDLIQYVKTVLDCSLADASHAVRARHIHIPGATLLAYCERTGETVDSVKAYLAKLGCAFG